MRRYGDSPLHVSYVVGIARWQIASERPWYAHCREM